MPTLRPRKRASVSSLSVPNASPATTTEPVSARSNPAVTMSRVDLPEPDGPTSAVTVPGGAVKETPWRTGLPSV